MKHPVFSIIVPCYNQGNFLRDCLDTLLRQSFEAWEAIVVNDGSSDDTSVIAADYAEKDRRIKLINKPNGGLSSARNAGIQRASGDRFIFLDADDYMYDNCLQVLVDHMKSLSTNEMLMYGYTYVSEDASQQLHSHLPGKEEPMIPAVFSSVPGPCHSICISKELLGLCGFFDETLRSLEDWDMWIRAAKAGGKLKCIQQCLVYYRYVNNSMSRNAPVMYASFKEVASRAPRKDERLSEALPGNRDYPFDVAPVLQECLIRALGVHVMQGHVEDALSICRKESATPVHELPVSAFESMCSSLSFRYWNSKLEVKRVMKEIMPRFSDFFDNCGMDQKKKNQIMYLIFKRHLYYKNIFEWGPFLGRMKNYLLRRKNMHYAIV